MYPEKITSKIYFLSCSNHIYLCIHGSYYRSRKAPANPFMDFILTLPLYEGSYHPHFYRTWAQGRLSDLLKITQGVTAKPGIEPRSQTLTSALSIRPSFLCCPSPSSPDFIASLLNLSLFYLVLPAWNVFLIGFYFVSTFPLQSPLVPFYYFTLLLKRASMPVLTVTNPKG